MMNEIVVYCTECKMSYPSKVDKRNGYLKCKTCKTLTGVIRNFKRGNVI